MDALQAEITKLVNDVAGDSRKAGLAMKEVLRDAAEPIRVEAARRAPVDTGTLRSAIFADRGDPAKSSAIVGVNHRVAPHGVWVEFGTAGPHAIAAQPFMRPAVEANRSNVRSIIAAGVAKIVSKYK